MRLYSARPQLEPTTWTPSTPRATPTISARRLPPGPSWQARYETEFVQPCPPSPHSVGGGDETWDGGSGNDCGTGVAVDGSGAYTPSNGSLAAEEKR